MKKYLNKILLTSLVSGAVSIALPSQAKRQQKETDVEPTKIQNTLEDESTPLFI